LTGIAYGKLAFVANVDGNWDLFTVDESGRNLKQFTKTPYDEKQPSWSSDKKEIVYATSDGLLNILNITDRKTRQLSIDGLSAPRMTPSISPDGNRIAFVQFKPKAGDDTDLFVYDLKTTRLRKVLDQKGIQMWPTWSPDGRRLVYANSHCGMDCGRFIQELWVADPNGGWARQLLMTNSFCQQPAWAPNGMKIAFSSDKGGNFDIWVISLDDWKLEQITNDESLDKYPAWSPDGKRLAFISRRSGLMEIWIKDLEKGKLRRLRPFGRA
jgi:TolB protein